MIRTRFAPSPTGYLHIGGLRTALYAYLYAKKHNGEFFLRIEDTDQERLVKDSLQNIIDTLNWAGLTYDEGPDKPGKHGPFIQSERLDLYQEHANKLLKEGHAYRCFCTRERLEEMRNDQMAAKKAPMYDRKCRYLTENEIQEKLNNGETFVVRQAVPLNRTIKFEDQIRGKMNFDTNTLDDHVLLKTDGFPTYHLAVVVDDHFMEITHVIRGEEWLPSTPKHILLYESFGWEPTTFAHLPLLLNKDRSKLSKRQNDVSTQSYIDKGYLKEAIINFIALLGWNTSDNNEIYSIEDLEKEFTIERVQKGGAVFDLDKLNWFNWQWKRKNHLAILSKVAKEIDPNVTENEIKKGEIKFIFADINNKLKFEEKNSELLLSYIEKHLNSELKTKLTSDKKFQTNVLKSLEEKILKEPENINEYIAFYFSDSFDFKTELFKNEKMQIDLETAKIAISESVKQLQKSDFESEEKLLEKFKKIIADLNLKNGQVLWPVRVALTNEEFSPGVFEVCYAYGYEKSLNHLKKAEVALRQN